MMQTVVLCFGWHSSFLIAPLYPSERCLLSDESLLKVPSAGYPKIKKLKVESTVGSYFYFPYIDFNEIKVHPKKDPERILLSPVVWLVSKSLDKSTVTLSPVVKKSTSRSWHSYGYSCKSIQRPSQKHTRIRSLLATARRACAEWVAAQATYYRA